MTDYVKHVREMVGNEKIIMVVAGALVFNSEGYLLLHQRTDTGNWGFPGGYMELGETVEETARREVFEETGLTLGQLKLFGIYSGPKREVTLSNGHQAANVKVIFTCNDYSGTPLTESNESEQIQFFPLDGLPDNLFPEQLHAIRDLLDNRTTPIID